MDMDDFSTVRLFVLGVLQETPCHGYEIVSTGERWAVHRWAGISTGAIYSAMRRLAKEGLIVETAHEKVGNRPERQIWGVTESGVQTLLRYIRIGLSSVEFEGREVDMALVFCHRITPKEREECLRRRLVPLQERLNQLDGFDSSYRRSLTGESPDLAEFKKLKLTMPWIHAGIRHGVMRIRAEREWTLQLVSEAPTWRYEPIALEAQK